MTNINHFKPGMLMCIDFLTAQSDYQEFCIMMLEFKAMNSWQEEQEEAKSSADEVMAVDEKVEEPSAMEESKE